MAITDLQLPAAGSKVAADRIGAERNIQLFKLVVGAEGQLFLAAGGSGNIDAGTLRTTIASDDVVSTSLDAMRAVMENEDPTEVALAQDEYDTFVASTADQILGAAGAAGDYLASVTIQPATTAPGSVVIKDGSTTVFTWPGSSSYPAHLAPITIPIGAKSKTGAWSITAGNNVSGLAAGDFT